jgi:uncharacterized repeat protein (TIGR03803 family)
MKIKKVCITSFAALLVLVATSLRLGAQETPSYTVLHTFTGSDGEFPQGSLIRDHEGNLYGTAFNGGNSSCNPPFGCGVVFKMDPTGKETVLYTFEGGADGAYPATDLLRDEVGNLYGTTHGGGQTTVAQCSFNPGCGVVFKVHPSGRETPLYAFSGGADGLGPSSGLVQDKRGNLYGTTIGGEPNGNCPGTPQGCGVVFKLDPNGDETVLHTFTGGADGYAPYGDLLLNEEGNLYGVASNGGDVSGFCGATILNATGSLGCGTVFKLDGTSEFTVLHTFDGKDGGPFPDGWLVRDNTGNLYGMTGNGGDVGACSGIGCGVVFKLDRGGKESVLYSFTGGADGAVTFASVIRDDEGNLYGTTTNGGDLNGCGGLGCGVVFKLDPNGKETVLHTFSGGTDGAIPVGGLLLDDENNLYGTSSGGGDPSCHCGVVFKIALHHCAEGDASTGSDRTTLDAHQRAIQSVRLGRFGRPFKRVGA